MHSESEITALARKVKRLETENDLLRQVKRAYEDLIASPQDATVGIALGTALAALKHHDANTETGRRLQAHLDRVENAPAYELAAGRYDDGDRGKL